MSNQERCLSKEVVCLRKVSVNGSSSERGWDHDEMSALRKMSLGRGLYVSEVKL